MWTPYRHLLHLSFWKCYKKRPNASGKVVLQSSQKMAEKMASYAHGDRVEKDQSHSYVWPSVSEGRPELCRKVEWSKRLKEFLVRGRRRGRRILDRLILAFAASGFNADDTVKKAYKEYETAPDVPELTENDVATYHSFCWNFAGANIDWDEAVNWVSRHFPNTDEERIVRGDLSVSSVRAKLGTTAGFNPEQQVQRITQQSIESARRCLMEVNSVSREELLYGQGGAGGNFSNANLRNTAAMISTLWPVISTYMEENGEEGKSDKPLGYWMDERLTEVIEEAEKAQNHYDDWEEMHQDNGVQELMEETRKIKEAKQSSESSSEKEEEPDAKNENEATGEDEPGGPDIDDLI